MLSLLFYLAVFALIFVVQTIAERKNDKCSQKRLVFFSYFIMLLLIGLRYNVGTDYVGHIEMYNEYSGASFEKLITMRGDIGSKLIIGMISPLLGGPLALFWIYGILTVIPLVIINKKQGYKHLAFSTLIYNLTILPASLNIIRQGAAMSFVLLAFQLTNGNRNGKTGVKILISMFIATVLHTSALLMAPYLLIRLFSNKDRKRYYKVAILLVTTVLSVMMLTSLRGVLKDIGFVDYDYMLRIRRNVTVSVNTILSNMLIILPVFLSWLVVGRQKRKEFNGDKDISETIPLTLSGIVFDVIGTAFNYLSRISYYFMIFNTVLLPSSIYMIRNNNTRAFVKIVCIIVLVSVFVVRCYSQGRYEIMPYNTWLFGGVY